MFTNKISIDCIVTDDIVTINISVPECRHKKHICEELGTEIARQTEKLVDICTATDTVIKTCSDFSDDELTDTELDELKDLFALADVVISRAGANAICELLALRKPNLLILKIQTIEY